jgi:Xaa-Pro aminopeptidase
VTSTSERIVYRLPLAELERRWALVRAQMNGHKLDVLIAQSSNECYGGYVRWFTDVPARHLPVTVIFPLEGGMTVISSGPRGGMEIPAADGSGLYRGVRQSLSVPYSSDECTTNTSDAELALSALGEVRHARIGMVGLGAMRYSFGEFLRRELPRAEFIDFSDAVDRIKAVKSDTELELVRQAARLQDRVMEEVFREARPGTREFELAAFAMYRCQVYGSTDGTILTGSAPMGQPAPIQHRYLQNRRLKAGDQFTILIEVNGPGGLYTELSRTCVLGRASQELLDEFEIVKEAQDATVARLKLGASPAEIWNGHAKFMRSRERPEERRLYAHGQGYDLVERPALRDNDPMPLAGNMNFAVHPAYATPRVYSWICDNYLLRPDGSTERLHRTPRKIFELG